MCSRLSVKKAILAKTTTLLYNCARLLRSLKHATQDLDGNGLAPARAEESLVSGELPNHLGSSGGVPVVDVVDGQLVVHATAPDEVPGLGKDGRHDPC